MTRHRNDGSVVHQHVCNEDKVYVVSEDIQSLLKEWADKKGFILPSKKFFFTLRREMKKKLQSYFDTVHFISEEGIKKQIDCLLEKNGALSTVSLDRAYKKDNCVLIEATRIAVGGSPAAVLGSRTQVSLDEQFNALKKTITQPIQLVDDVIFSGNSNIELIKRFNSLGMNIDSMVVGVSVENGVNCILDAFPEIKIRSLHHYTSVVDEVCERDFYAGVPYSGRLLGTFDGGFEPRPLVPEQGASYFAPFGDPHEWASIPEKHEKDWSIFCLEQSIRLWEAIEEASKKKVLCSDLTRIPRLCTPMSTKRFVDFLKESLHHPLLAVA